VCFGAWRVVERTKRHQGSVDKTELGSFCGRDGMFAVGWDSCSPNSAGDARRCNCPRCNEVDTGSVVRWKVGLIERRPDTRPIGSRSFIAEFDHLLEQERGFGKQLRRNAQVSVLSRIRHWQSVEVPRHFYDSMAA